MFSTAAIKLLDLKNTSDYPSFHTASVAPLYRIGVAHKVRIYKEYHCVCPLVRIGTLPTPLSPASKPLPPEPEGGGHTRLRVRGWGSPNSDDLRKA
jgi:hypothetical protein